MVGENFLKYIAKTVLKVNIYIKRNKRCRKMRPKDIEKCKISGYNAKGGKTQYFIKSIFAMTNPPFYYRF